MHMTTLHAQLIGDKAVLPRDEFERLVELARRSDEITLQMETDEAPTVGIMRLEEDLYTVNDLKVRYR